MASKPLTANQIKSLHPAVRVELKAGRLTESEAALANRLVRFPYLFISRIALRVVREKINKGGIDSLKRIRKAMPKGAPAGLLETVSFAVLEKKKPLDEAVKEVQEAAASFKKVREAKAKRPPRSK